MSNHFITLSAKSFSMPIHQILNIRKGTTFECFGQNNGRFTFGSGSLIKSFDQFGHVMTINDYQKRGKLKLIEVNLDPVLAFFYFLYKLVISRNFLKVVLTYSMEIKTFHSSAILVHIMFKGSWVTLTKAVNINDSAKVVQFIIT